MSVTTMNPAADAAGPPKADPAPGKAVVLYDGDCPFCRKSVAILEAVYRSARRNGAEEQVDY